MAKEEEGERWAQVYIPSIPSIPAAEAAGAAGAGAAAAAPPAVMPGFFASICEMRNSVAGATKGVYWK